MRSQVRLLISALAVASFTTSSFAQKHGPKECQLEGNQLELNQCAYFKFMKADADMNRLYKEQMSHLSPEPKSSLIASQRAWLVYRDRTCLYETGPREGSGSIWPMLDALCREKLTTQRNSLLSSYVECRQNGCPE